MPSRASSTGGRDGDGPAGSFDQAGLAQTLRTTLGLRFPPVALTFVREPPDGIDAFAGAVPSACTFWRRCEEDVFYAPAEAHFNCPIGAMTMGFALPEEIGARLIALVGEMCELNYLGEEEAASIPSVPGEGAGIVYGPLERFPLSPDVVLVWVSGSSAMLLDEASRASRWTPEQTGTASFGRPSCAAIAVAMRRDTATFSVGCSGMRTFTEIPENLQLAVVPGAVLPTLSERLATVDRANEHMLEHYSAQKALFGY